MRRVHRLRDSGALILPAAPYRSAAGRAQPMHVCFKMPPGTTAPRTHALARRDDVLYLSLHVGTQDLMRELVARAAHQEGPPTGDIGLS